MINITGGWHNLAGRFNVDVVEAYRVSTLEQAEGGYSVTEQQERLTAFCKAKGWELVGTYGDPGVSGAKLDRPGLNKLIEDCNKHLFDVVAVYKLDRLSRSQKDTLYLIEDVFDMVLSKFF